MSIKQLSIFIENKAGRLADVTETLAENKVDIRAISVADTSDFGILRVVVDNPELAQDVLKKSGMTVNLSKVIAVCIGDKPGELSKVIRILSDNSISIEYVYDFAGKKGGKACIILRVDDSKKATQILSENDVEVLSQDNICEI